MAGGLHKDEGKAPLALVPRSLLEAVSRVLEFGARKYKADNWRLGIEWRRVAGSLLRHTFAWLEGEDKDPESGLSHLAHAATNVAFLLEYERTHQELDDRYMSGKVEL